MALVFVSCGQGCEKERKTAARVKQWLEGQGYEVFVALETQSLSDLNSGTIGHLKRADYFLFIDFPREYLSKDGKSISDKKRGSLYTHQELALSYLLGFPEAIFLKHENVELKGIAQFMMANATTFTDFSEVPEKVEELVTNRNWSSNYSRHLIAHVNNDFVQIKYFDHTDRNGRDDLVAFAQIENRRSDTAASHTVAKLLKIEKLDPDRKITLDSPDKSQLKWAGHLQGYDCLILPTSKEKFSLFAIEAKNPTKVNLHSDLDVVPRNPIIETVGCYHLTYEVYSLELPPLTFTVELNLTDSSSNSSVNLVKQWHD